MPRSGGFNTGGFKRQYPPGGALTFDGGLNNKFERALIEDNESPDCQNVTFENGSVRTRDGFVKVNTNAVSAQTFTGIYTRRSNTNAETMVVWAGTDMFTLGTTTFLTVPSGQGVFAASTRVAAAMQENYLFIGQSGTTAYKWDGSLLTRHGIPAPTATHSVASNGVGFLTGGDYRYN